MVTIFGKRTRSIFAALSLLVLSCVTVLNVGSARAFGAQSGAGLIASGMFGDGSDGDLVVGPGQTLDATTVRTAVTANAAAGQQALPVANAAAFDLGDEIMVVQTQGAGAGLYEFGFIAAKSSTLLSTVDPLAHTYTVGGASHAQVLKVPHYHDVTVQNGGSLTSPAWDGSTGGVLVFRASGTFAVNGGGTVTMASKGYRGAPTNGSGYGGSQGEGQNGLGNQSTGANGSGGGGGCSNGYGNPAGGGGGGNGTSGTAGNPGNNSNCDIAGAGGTTTGTSDLKEQVFPGGGGGSGGAKNPSNGNHAGGYGGTGGGIIIAFASNATIGGTFNANGQNGGLGNGFNTSANGGGGAGGSIMLVVRNGSVSTSLDAVNGAGGLYTGDLTENGGPGGLGRILVHYCDTFSGSTSPPATLLQVTCNAAPVAQNDLYATAANTTLTVPAPGVLANDSDPDSSTLTAALINGPASGAVTLNADGSFTYTPLGGFAGDDSFTYQASDGLSLSNTATVTITVTDQTPPVVTGHADRDPAPYTWFNAPVTITWTAQDPAPSSGAPTTPVPVTVSTDGANQVITSGQSCDPAGNCATGQYTVSVDQAAPTISYTIAPAANAEGWNSNDVTVTFTCADALSGISACTTPVTLTADGTAQSVAGMAIDNAGNTATTTATVNLDKTKPQIGYTLSAPANANGWHSNDVSVTYSCTDATSGITTCPVPVTVDAETPGLTVTGATYDTAGNSATTSVMIKLDKTAPQIGYALSPAANGDGWNNTDVTVSFTCTDALSGIAVCPAPVTVTGHGAAQTVTGTAIDVAGNTASATATINIDKVAPQVSYTITPAANNEGWRNSTAIVTFACSDDLSGVAFCPPPATVDTDTTGQIVSGTAYDKAGNSTTATVVVKLDKTAPVITGTPYPASNSLGWNNTDVAIFFSCSDATSGIASCSDSPVLTTEGANQSVSGQAIDHAGNMSTTTVTISIDKTPPTLGSPTWTVNPKPAGTPSAPVDSTVSIPATDTLSGVLRGEYFIGADPGLGNGTSMPLLAGNLTATLGAGLPVGVYDIGIRALDTAGNWSAVTTTMLVIYDPAALSITGRNNNDLIPSLAAGDVLPGLTSPTQTDTADYGFTVEYRNGALDPNNDFHFIYTTGSHCHTPNPANCHELSLNATSFAWLIIDQTNNSRGRFQGTATVTVDGTTTTNVFTLEGIDGDRLTPTTDDHFLLKIYAPGANPDTATPLYQASGTLAKGNAIRIR